MTYVGIKIINSFIAELGIKYAHHQSIPYWLHQGVALYVAQFFDPDKVRTTLAQELDKVVPTIAQLDVIPKYDTIAFDTYDGFRVSYSIVEFIDTQWGWDTVIQILNNYTHFESVVGVSKNTFTEQWRAYLT